MQFVCPPASELAVVPDADCASRIGQIVRAAISFTPAAGAELFDAVTSGKIITAKSAWIAALAASGAAKVSITPPLYDAKITPSEGKSIGGDDNTTPYGQPIYTGEGTPKMTFHFADLNNLQIAKLRELSAASAGAGYRLSIFLFNEFNAVICLNTGTEVTPKYSGIPFNNLRLGTLGNEGKDALTKSDSGLNLLPYWDEKYKIIPLAFNPYTDL